MVGVHQSDWSVNLTVRGTVPLIGDAVNFAIGITKGTLLTVITLVFVVLLLIKEPVALSNFVIVRVMVKVPGYRYV